MKAILSILLFISLQSAGQYYYVIPTMNNPENKARMISKGVVSSTDNKLTTM